MAKHKSKNGVSEKENEEHDDSSEATEAVESNELNQSVSDNPDDLSNFAISEKIVAKLIARGVTRLFPVQCKTFNEIVSGMNVIAQAHTGTGKTFAFAIPIVEMLQASKKLLKEKSGRKPSALVLAPTRELAKQIASDFKDIIDSPLKVLAVYGGVPYEKHTEPLSRGVDVLVGAPGRIKDLLDQGHLSLKRVRYVVLDEVDRMLDMGFRDVVDSILNEVYPNEDNLDKKKVPQTLLFSATLPAWVTELSAKYLAPVGQKPRELHKICLTGDTSNPLGDSCNKTASTVEHLALQCPWQERPTAIADVIRCYCSGPDSRCIIFCEMKKQADELAAHSAMSSECHVMHGDIPQEKRELVLEKFRSGKYRILVTTNVAARGLDIPSVDLVIQCRPPTDVEDYIHRSGRTGRAGRSGKCICFYTPKERPELQRIESAAGITFRRINCPTPEDIVRSSEGDTILSLAKIPEDTWKVFQSTAVSLIEELGAERALSCALAKLSGKVEAIKPRSLLTTREGFTAYVLKIDNDNIRGKGYAYNILRRCLSETLTESISHLMFLKDRKGFVFDLPSSFDEEFSSSWQDGKFETAEVMTELPELDDEEKYVNGAGRGGGGFQSRGGGRGGRGGGNFRGGFRNGDQNGNFRGRGRGGNRGSFNSSEGRGRGGRGFNRGFSNFNGRGEKRPHDNNEDSPAKMPRTESSE